jgi:mono/diheme cytochrome c family protein
MVRTAPSLLMLAGIVLAGSGAKAAERVLTITFGPELRSFDAVSLLARPETRSIVVPNDVAYRRQATYRAVPLLALLDGLPLERSDVIEARATDGYVAQIPMALIRNAAGGGAVPWIAVEEPGSPWPSLPGKSFGAGPFYLVWIDPELSRIGQEQWSYALASLSAVETPLRRWPQISVDPALPADASERRGQALVILNCLPCHRVLGGGEGEMGPDLVQPRSPTEYMSPAGLAAQIRNPKSLRSWPSQQMPSFDETTLPGADIDAIVFYLRHMARRRDAAR